VDKSNLGIFGLNLKPNLGELGDRLAAKGSTEMAQKDQQQRLPGHQGPQGHASGRLVCA